MKISRPFLISVSLMMATIAMAIDSLLPAIPNLADSLSVTVGEAQLAVTMVILGFSLTQIPMGFFSDRFGRRRVALLAMGGFALAALGAALSTKLWMLLLFRFLQGVFGAAGPTIARAILRDVSTPEEGARRMSFMVSVLGMVMIVAPLLAAVLVSHFNWRAVMLLSIAYALLISAGVGRYATHTSRLRYIRHSFRFQLAFSLRQFLRSRKSILYTAVFSFAFAGYFSFVTTGSGIIHHAYGKPPYWFSLLFAGLALNYSLFSYLNQYWVTRFGPGKMLRAAMAVVCLSSVGFVFLSTMGLPPLWWVVAGLVVYGGAFSIVMPTASALTLQPLPKTAGFASAILGTAQTLLGALFSLVATRIAAENPAAMCLLVAGGGLVATAILLAGPTLKLVPKLLPKRRLSSA